MGLGSWLAASFGRSELQGGAVHAAALQGAGLDASQPLPRPRRRSRGGAGTLISAGIIDDLDPNTEVRGSYWYGQPGVIGIADKMLRDPHVRQSLEYLIAPLIAANWRFRPASKSELDREVADFCTFAFLECLNFKAILRRKVRGYVKDGFSLSEMTDDFRTIPMDRFPHHPGTGVGVVPTGFHERPAWSVYRWHQSRRNPAQIRGVMQQLRGSDEENGIFVEIPASRLLRLTWDQDGANYAGMAPLRSAYGSWKIKKVLETIDAIKHERVGVGIPALTLGEEADEEDIAAAETILAEMRANEKGFVILPNGYKFEWTKGGEGSNLDAAISRCNIDIATNVAAGFMLLGLTGKVGSFALGGTQQGQHHLQVSGHAEFVAAAFNFGSDGWSPVERIVRLNYGDVPLPRLEARNLPTRNWQEVAKTFFAGVQTGALTADDPTEDRIREALQLDPLDVESIREKPQAMPPMPFGAGPMDEDEDEDESDDMDDEDDGAEETDAEEATE